jgi:ribosomal protein L23
MANQEMGDVFKKELSKQFYDIIKRVIVTEKTTRAMEFDNVLTFEVDKRASKILIKLLIETELGKKVKSVNTVNSITGKKRAFVSFVDEGAASKLAAELKLV